MTSGEINIAELPDAARYSETIRLGERIGLDRSTLELIVGARHDATEAVTPRSIGDLTDAEWDAVAPYLSGQAKGRGDSAPRRFVSAILWLARGGNYRALPPTYGSREVIRTREARWAENGLTERLYADLAAAGQLSPERLAEFAEAARVARELRLRRTDRRATRQVVKNKFD